MHHWDASHAAGTEWQVPAGVAAAVSADSVDEFLHFSLASDDDPDDPVKPPLEGSMALRALDTGDAWTLSDGARPGTVRVSRGLVGDVPVLQARAADLLLWLYDRATIDTGPVPQDLLGRLLAMRFTD